MQAPSRLKPVPLEHRVQSARLGSVRKQRAQSVRLGVDATCGTGFSRERDIRHAAELRVHVQASSRLKPVPLKQRA